MKERIEGRAARVGLYECEGECSVHIVLFNEDDDAYADAPMTPAMCRRFGKALVRIGMGEDVPQVLLDEGFATSRRPSR